ncbi:MAG: hypothetical protein DRJ03_01245 [Chloroflexi bacterium]|nr:MAG: hypothetical protein DRJ03_01245 [Chloroflexota bacterium]
MDKMKGWKTVAGAALIAVAALAELFGLAGPEITDPATQIGIATAGVGVAGKFVKLGEILTGTK